MAASIRDGRRSRADVFNRLIALCASALLVASCSSMSNGAAAIEASQNGDQKTAVRLAQKEVARFSAPDQCSPATTYNCGTLALAYGSLAEYQILDGDTAAGERSFAGARAALARTDIANRPSATAMVYRDVSEAYWKTGDRARATVVFKEGRAAGADGWLANASAASVADAKPSPSAPDDGPAAPDRAR